MPTPKAKKASSPTYPDYALEPRRLPVDDNLFRVVDCRTGTVLGIFNTTGFADVYIREERLTPVEVGTNFCRVIVPAKLGQDNLPDYFVCHAGPMGGISIVYVANDRASCDEFINRKDCHGVDHFIYVNADAFEL